MFNYEGCLKKFRVWKKLRFGRGCGLEEVIHRPWGHCNVSLYLTKYLFNFELTFLTFASKIYPLLTQPVLR